MERGKEKQGQKAAGGQVASIQIAALAGLSGTMRVDVKDQPTATIHLENGRVWAGDPGDKADAVATVQERSDFEKLLAGELNPVVAAIQGRLVLAGNPELATRLVAALNAAKPFAKSRPGQS
jgi:putative sterol carrier protein